MDNSQQKVPAVEQNSSMQFLKKAFKILAPLALGVLILYFLYRDTNFSDMWNIIKNANYGILLFSLLFGLFGNTIRGIRWKLLIAPLGYETKTRNLVYAVLGSYAVNFLLPRAGEVWRCGIIAKQEKIPFTKLLGTIIVDRLFDTIMVLLIIALAFAFNASVFLTNSSQFALPEFLTSPWLYLAIIGAFVLLVVILKVFKSNFLVKKVNDFLSSVWKDVKTVWGMKEKKKFLLYTVGIWVCYFFYFYITFFAFDFTTQLGFAAGLFVFAISSVSMGIPSNGGLGPWQAAVVFGLVAYFVDSEQAKAFATAVFTVQSVWVVMCGLFGIAGLSTAKSKA